MIIHLPGIAFAISMSRRRGDDVAPIAANIEPHAEGLDPVLDVRPRVGKEVVNSTARQGGYCFRQGMVGLLEGAETVVAPLVAVAVQYDQAGDGAGGNANVRLGPPRPPAADDLLVCCGVPQPVFGAGMLAD